MDVSDADFDSYWENESRNNNRNRIRVGRQYQATVPPLLRPGESDGRRLEDLETLRWRPESLSDQSIDEYLSMAKAVSLFARAMDKWQAWGEGGPEGCCLQTALRGLSDFVTSHHGCHHDAGCQVGPTLPCHWTPTEASLFARALDECGKNFGAIKKDFLPWKPVKSLIEFYYQGRMPKQEDDDQQGAGCSSGANCSGSNCVKKEPEVKEEPVEQEEEPCEEVEEKKEEETALAPTAAEASTTASAAEGEEEGPGSSGGAVSGPEVKPMRAKPLKNPEEGPNGAPVGSLKFFLGGRLVLKLSAQEGGAWVEAQDTPRLGQPRLPPSEDASEDEESAPGGSGTAPGAGVQRGVARCTSWPETATPVPPGASGGACTPIGGSTTPPEENHNSNSTEDEDGDESPLPPASPKCLTPAANAATTAPGGCPLNLTIRPPVAKGQASSSPPLLLPQAASLTDGCADRCRPTPGWRPPRPTAVPFLAPLFSTQCCSATFLPVGTADAPLDLSSPVDTKKLPLVPK